MLMHLIQDYSQDCDSNYDCQPQIVDIDTVSSVGVYSLSTVYTTWQLSVDDDGVVYYSDNENGLAETITVWTQ